MLLGIAESLLNDSIAASSAARQRAERLDGASLRVDIEGLGLSIHCSVSAGRIALSRGEGSADVELSGTPLDLLRLLGPDSFRELRGSKVKLGGDLQVAEAFADLLRVARPDLEEALSDWTGDIAAHAIGERVRGLVSWSMRASKAIGLDTTEYLQEESSLLPGPRQVRAFCAEVDHLRDDVERAAERLERLSQALASRV